MLSKKLNVQDLKQLEEGSKVKIRYDIVEKNFRKQLEDNKRELDKMPALIHMLNIDGVVEDELKNMKKYDSQHGKIRTVKHVYIKNRFTKNEITRYELDNKFVFYISELEEVGE